MHLQKIEPFESWFLLVTSVLLASELIMLKSAEAPPASHSHHLAPAKLARAAVPATPALPGLPGAVPRRLGAVWLTGPGDPGAKKAVPAAPRKAAPTICAIAPKILQAERRANVRLSQVCSVLCPISISKNL